MEGSLICSHSAMSQTIWKAGEDESHKKGNSLTL